MPHPEIEAVILAAGRGHRLRPLSLRTPKPLLPVGNRSVIEHQIEAARTLGVRRVTIVVGHLAPQIVHAFGNGDALGVEVRYVEQHQPLGIAHAVAQLEPHVTRPFVTFLGDIFFMPDNLPRMLELFSERHAGAVLAVKRESNPEFIKRNFSVSVGPDGLVRRVVEKPRYVEGDLKGCGIYLFDLPVFDAIRQTPRTAMRDEYEITHSIQIMIESGYPVVPAEVIAWDMNLTEPADLLACNLQHLASLGRETLVHPEARVHPSARIERAVVGPGAEIGARAELRDSLVMAGTCVPAGSRLEWALASPDGVIDCRPGGDRPPVEEHS